MGETQPERCPEIMEKLVSLCKRRGYLFQSSEIYGGLNSCWDYGPLGVELKRNVKDAWWQRTVHQRDDVEGLDASILMHPKVWESSGHIAGFSDPLIDCKKCKSRFREDHLQEEGLSTTKCPKCEGEMTEARQFNLMFKTFMGPVEETSSTVYLRPETAQGIFVNFKNVQTALRKKPPFGIAQVGKSFRNEITPGNFIFRTREFEQMEMEFFVPPSEDEKWYDYWKNQRFQWYIDLGIDEKHLMLRDHAEDELAHYAKACVDVEFLYPFGWSELEGIANRTDYDLKAHEAGSGNDMSYFDDQTRERYHPYVIEPAAGADRATLAFLVEAYREEELEKGTRVVLGLHPRLAPIKAAILPLVKKDGMPEKAQEICKELREEFPVFYDQGGAVGRRYRRMDEAGTPYCFTIDGDTMTDDTVTVRDRDTMEQKRMPVSEIADFVKASMKF